MRITPRLVIAIAVPLIIFAVLAGYDLYQTWRVRSEMATLTEMAEGATKISRLVHHLQRERGASAVFVSSKGAQMREELSVQRKLTDEQRAAATDFLSVITATAASDEFKDAAAKAGAALGLLDGKRKDIDGLGAGAQDATAYFTDTIAKLLAVAGEIAKVSSRGETSTAIAAYVSLMQGKERAGQERAVGAAGLYQGKFDQPGYARILGLRAAQDAYFGLFTAAATPAQRSFFESTMSGAAAKTVAKMREVIAAGGLSGELQGLDGKAWFDATTARIDLLKTVEDHIAADLIDLAGSIRASADHELTVISIVIAAAFAVSLTLAFMIARGISKPLGRIGVVLDEIAKGNKDVEVPYADRRDEIGDSARAAKAFKENLLRVEKLEAEQKANEARSAAEREAAMQKMADEFEAAVGGIVDAAVAGDFSQRVDLTGTTGLVRNIGTALNSLCDNVGKSLDDLIRMLNALAGGDMTQRISAEYQGMFGELKKDANAMAEQIGSTIADIKASAKEVANASAEISTSTTDLSQRTEEQAAGLEQTSSSMEEIAATVKKNAENAQRANSSVGSTREVAGRGGQVVAKAVEAMAKIEDSSRKISDIIGVIDEIARQTNLLALNAAVEAARAGEAGRGFAVVASEVRSLAQRSSQAAKDIKDLITNSNGQVKDGVALVNQAGTALTEIVDSFKSVAEIVADIANASAEQAGGIEQVNKALTQMDEVTQQNSALVEENAATAKTLEHQARAMDERVAFFKLDEAAESADGARPASSREQRPAAARERAA
jgi:methyl-accepting chemotaxis protein